MNPNRPTRSQENERQRDRWAYQFRMSMLRSTTGLIVFMSLMAGGVAITVRPPEVVYYAAAFGLMGWSLLGKNGS